MGVSVGPAESSSRSLIDRIQSDPLNVPLYWHLSELYDASKEFGKAIRVLRQALNIGPREATTWARLGMLCGKTGRWQDSADAFEHACALKSEDTSYLSAYGFALLASQDLPGASKVSTVLLEGAEGRGESHLLAGHLHKVQGRFEQATDCYRRALQINDRLTEALYNLVDIGPAEAVEEVAAHLHSLNVDSSLSSAERANVCFALARNHERADRIDAAYEMLETANRAADTAMTGIGCGYDPGKAQERVNTLIRVFASGMCQSALEPIDLDFKLIFIVGLPRSGTTLVERILSNHSAVVTGGEQPFMQECLDKFLAGLESLARDERAEWTEARRRQLLCSLRDHYLDRLFERDLDGPYVIDKLPANFEALGLIGLLFPNAVVVHCMRDPVATCWSLYAAHFGIHVSYNTSFAHLIHYYGLYDNLMKHWRTALTMPIIEARYEEIVANPPAAARVLVSACGLPWEEACTRIEANPNPTYTASMREARGSIHTNSLSRWRKFQRYLAPLQGGLAGHAQAYARGIASTAG